MRLILSLVVLALVSACSPTSDYDDQVYDDFDPSMSRSWDSNKHEECVPFARRRSGIQIRGNAHTWWNKCDPNQRSVRPKEGAVMVLSKTRRLRYGHLAVVKDLVSRREINVTHTNWGSNRKKRLVVYESMRVKDVSPNNDWSSAVFWNKYTNAYGSPYKVSGFILP